MAGKSRSVLRFDGPSNIVEMGSKPEHKIRRDITLEAWVYVTRHQQWAGIVSRIFDTGSTESGYGLLLDGAGGVYCGLRTTLGPAQNFYYSSGPQTLALNQWHHVAATYNGAQIILYIDGQPKLTAALLGDIKYDPDHALTIGAFKDSDECYPFSGRIAEVRLWDTARSVEQLRSYMYHRLRGDEPNLVGYWPLDEGSGATVKDLSARGHHGQISGATWERAEVSFAEPAAASSPGVRPNILLIVGDDLGVDLLRINDRGEVTAQIDAPDGTAVGGQRLPTIEKLVRHGRRFTKAWAHPVCSPTRASLLTGLAPWRTGIGWPSPTCPLPETRTDAPQPIRSLAEVMSNYRSAMFGKWDLGMPTPGKKRTAADWGWHRFEGLIDSSFRDEKQQRYWYPVGEEQGSQVMRLETLDSDEKTPDAPPHALSERRRIKVRAEEYLREVCPDYVTAQRDIRYYIGKKDIEDIAAGIRRYSVPPTERTHLYVTKDQVFAARDWIKQMHGRPWCVTLALVAPHDPFHVPPQESFTIRFKDPAKPTTPELLVAMVQSLDFYIGQLLDSKDIEIREQLKNTVIVFVGDNGTQDDDPDSRPDAFTKGEHIDDDMRDKGTYFIGGMHVPLIVADGGSLLDGAPCFLFPINGTPVINTSSSEPVHIIDLFATCVEIAGSSPASGVDSISMLPLLKNTAGDKRSYQFSQEFPEFGQASPCHASISDGKYKLSCTRTKYVDGHKGDSFKYVLFLLEPHDKIPGALKETEITDFIYKPAELAIARRLHAELKKQRLTGGQPPAVEPLPFPELPEPETAFRYVRLLAKSEVNGNPWTTVADFHVLVDGKALDRSRWDVQVDSNETEGENGAGKNAIDGQSGSFWHTPWYRSAPRHPHWLRIDLQSPQRISGFKYLPRQNGENGRIAEYEFQVSSDGQSWQTVAAGRFPNTAQEQVVNINLLRS